MQVQALGLYRSGLPDRPMIATRACQLKEGCSSSNRACELLKFVYFCNLK